MSSRPQIPPDTTLILESGSVRVDVEIRIIGGGELTLQDIEDAADGAVREFRRLIGETDAVED